LAIINTEINEKIIKSGYLKKKGEKRKAWKKRWFVLRSNRLSYYKNEKVFFFKNNIILFLKEFFLFHIYILFIYLLFFSKDF